MPVDCAIAMVVPNPVNAASPVQRVRRTFDRFMWVLLVAMIRDGVQPVPAGRGARK